MHVALIARCVLAGMRQAIGTFDLDDYQALVRMAQSGEPFAAKIAQATLAIVEARRDAEVRAAAAEAALEHERARLQSVRDVLRALTDATIDGADATRRICAIVN